MRRALSAAAVVLALAPALAGAARADDARRYRPGPAYPTWIDGPDVRPGGARTPAAAPAALRCADPCDPRFDRRRGPIEVRDMYPLAQPRLSLPDVGPDTLGCGRTSVRAQFHWSNAFGWRQDVTGEDPAVRWFLVDGETRTVDATVMHGFADDLDVGVRVPFHWRGAGVLDAVIDAFHGSASWLFQDNKRGDFENDRFRLHGLLDDGTPFDQDEDTGAGLGNVEGLVRWRCLDGGRDGLSLALVGRVTAPTGAAPFDPEGVEAGLQLVGAKRVAPRWDVYAGLGETWLEEPAHRGVRYAEWRTSGFVGAEWRFAARASLLVQVDYAGPLVTDVANFAGDFCYVHVGVKLDLAGASMLELGFTENVVNQQTTSDFGAWVGVDVRF